MAIIVVVLIKRLRLKPARQDSTAKFHLRSSVWSARSDFQARKQQRNVKLGEFLLSSFSSSYSPSYLSDF